MYKCIHFELYELVSKQVYDRYGETAWQFFDEKLLRTIDWIRETIGKPITINNWFWGGDFDERGLRCNLDPIVKGKTNNNKIYLSAHVLARAVDFDVSAMTAHEVRKWLIENKSGLPFNIRLEKDVNWVHLDTYDKGVKIYLFAP